MPLILKAAGERIYLRSGLGTARSGLEGLQGWKYLKDRSETANTFTFNFPEPCFLDGTRYVPGPRDEVYIYKNETDYTNDTRWFGGVITSVTDQSVIGPNGGFSTLYSIEAGSFDVLLEKELRQPTLANQTWEDILTYLVTRHFSGQLSSDVSNIDAPENAPPIKINNGKMRDVLRAMRILTGRDYTVDAYKKLHVFLPADNPAPFDLDDSVSGILSFDATPQVRVDSRQIFNLVRQPFRDLIDPTEWEGESFTGKGDPKGTGGQLPLLRTPADSQNSSIINEQFDGDINDTTWVETDDTNTHHPDFPNEGYLFTESGQLQLLGGTGTLGGVALVSSDFYQYAAGSYIVQEFQLTNATGEGYISLFTDGLGLSTGNFKGGLHVLDGALKALDGTTLVASLGTTTNYILWVSLTADGFQYDILGGAYGTRQTLHVDTGVTHLSDYTLAPIVNKSMECSINTFRYQTNERGIYLEIDGVQKTVGLEGSSEGLPDIDAYLNIDETPAVLKFRAASDLAVIATVSDATHISVATSQGDAFSVGHRLIIGDDIVEAFDGREAFVAAVSGDDITLVSPGLSGMSPGQVVLVDTTIPAKDTKILVKYSFEKDDEAVVRDAASVETFGAFPLTLELKDHIRDFTSAQQEAQAYLNRFKDGLLKVSFTSNQKLVDEPDSLMALDVNLTRRPDPITRTLTIQRVVIFPQGEIHRYEIDAESADPVKPLDDLIKDRNLVFGSEGAITLTVSLEALEASKDEITIHEVSSLYITLANLEGRRLGEFMLAPPTGAGELDFSDEDNSGFIPLI